MSGVKQPKRFICAGSLMLIAALASPCPSVCASGRASNSAIDPQQSSQQAAAPSQDDIPNPQLKLSPTEALRQFEPAADEEYTLGGGDEVSIQVAGRPELATKTIIGPDGRVTLPMAGTIEIGNLTREGAANKIAEAYSKYYTSVTASLDVLHYGSNHVTLLGDVKSPGTINFDQTPTLLEVLSKGGIDAHGDGSIPDRCVIYRGDKVEWVELQMLLTSGSPLADLRLRRNDIIFVPAANTRTVTVMGAVAHPGEVPLRGNSTVVSILSQAGSISDGAGSNPEIQIVHRSKGGTTQFIRFKDLLKPTIGNEISLNAGDVVYVPKSGMAKAGFVMQQLAPFLTIGSFATAFALH